MKNIFLFAFITMIISSFSGCSENKTAPAEATVSGKAPDRIVCEQYRSDISRTLTTFAQWGMQYNNSVELLDAQNSVVGYLLLPPEKYERVAGYNDYINTAVLLSPEKRIISAVLGKHSETPRFIKRVQDNGFMNKWNGMTPAEAAELKVDAITRATYSCNAISSEVKAVCLKYK